MNEILTHEELQKLLERNNANPDIGRPVYVAWSHNRGNCYTHAQLSDYLKRNNVPTRETTYPAWEAKLNSATLRCQVPGQKEAYVIKRAVKTREGWTEVPLNSKRV